MAEEFDGNEPQSFEEDCTKSYKDFFEDYYMYDESGEIKILSDKFTAKITTQGDCPSFDIGFKNILNSKSRTIANLDISSRGLQKVTLSSSLEEIIKNLKFKSTLTFNSFYSYLNLCNKTTFTYPITDDIIARLMVNIEDIDTNISATLKYNFANSLSFACFFALKEFKTLELIQLAAMYSLNEFIDLSTIISCYNILHKNLNQINSIDIKCIFKASDNVRLGIDYLYENKSSLLTLGYESKEYKDTILKSKIISDGINSEIEAAVYTKISDNIRVTASTRFDAATFRSSSDCDFGLGFEYHL